MPRRHEHQPVFLPDHLDIVRAIALRGLTDKEMANELCVEPKLMQSWRELYPDFAAAIEDGRTEAEAAVVRSVYESATGYEHPEEKVFQWDGEILRAMTTKHYKPDIAAAKFWLTNRQKEYWKDRHHTSISGGADDASPIGLSTETKQQVMSSILALIQCKPDPVPELEVEGDED